MNPNKLGPVEILTTSNPKTAFNYFKFGLARLGLQPLLFMSIAVLQGILFSRIKSVNSNIEHKQKKPSFYRYRKLFLSWLLIIFFGCLIYAYSKMPSLDIKYYKSGNKKSIGAYSFGKRHGDWQTFYENGQLKSAANFDNGLHHGKCIEYYENGNVKTEWYSTQGKLDGTYVHYFENGKPNIESHYFNDSLHGTTKSYNEKGDLLSEINYEYGSKK